MMAAQPDSDRPLSNPSDDLFGFVGIAKKLAPAILKTFETDGMVVGLEGPWGSGKTTLLNFLRSELDTSKPTNINVITIAPWLSGDLSNLVSSLLVPIADILDKTENNRHAKGQKIWRRAKKAGSSLGAILRDYGAKTGRTLAPAARFAEYFLPGAKVAADGLETGAQYLENFRRHPTTAEIKAEISRKLSELDIGFIVILDDIDRLAPEQAVEVVRLVRSVADFPKITYIMCYDRDALSHALMSGLKVADGDQFLQKIVQLTFTMPLPEPFDMRRQFLTEATTIFEEVVGNSPTGPLLDDLKSAVDREGTGLRTPREVKLALNSLRFLFPSIKEEIYFPDLCRIHLIKTTQPALYRWIEEYLTERSVIVTGDGTISTDEKIKMGTRLKELLPAGDTMSTQSIWNLRRYIPGVVKQDKPDGCVFANTSIGEVKDMIQQRRIGSPIHYRHYFALTYPKTVMPDHEFAVLLSLAATDSAELGKKFVALAQEKRSSGKSWFEHILDRLDHTIISGLSAAAIAGIIEAITNGMDTILAEDKVPRPFALTVSDLSARTVRDCLTQLKTIDPNEFGNSANRLAANCQSMNWLVGRLFRDELYTHGYVGEQQQGPGYSPFSKQEIDGLLRTLKERATGLVAEGRIAEMPDLGIYLYGWRDLSGIDEPRAWVERYVADDEGFLLVLDALRSWAMSDRVYYPLSRSSVEVFLNWEETIRRLQGLAETKHAVKAKELLTAIEQGGRY